MEGLDAIHKLLMTQRPVDWAAMPDIALYMDQVISYLPWQTIDTGDEPPLTSAMVNNYIKDGLLPRANGKRYNKEHLAYLTAIVLLKNVLSVKDIKLLLGEQIHEGEVEDFYEHFLEKLDTSLEDVASVVDDSIGSEDISEYAMNLAIVSCAAKIACVQLLSLLRSQREPEESAKEKKG